MRFRGWAVSDVGRRRSVNEDHFLCDDDLSLYAVADGMGGHMGGETASRLALEVLRTQMAPVLQGAEGELAGQPRPPSAQHWVEALEQSFERANLTVFETGQARAELAGMGTTLTALLCQRDRAFVCHVGDSRLYSYRDGVVRQRTEDHSWIQEQINAGFISAEEARGSQYRNIITRSVGFDPVVQPDLEVFSVEAGDCFLLCSDGLSQYLTERDMGQILAARYYSQVPDTLVDIANDRGGEDNITCLLVYASNEA